MTDGFCSPACHCLVVCSIAAWPALDSRLSPTTSAWEQLDGTKFSLASEEPAGPIASKNIY